MAVVAPGLVLRILLISPRKSANSFSRITRHKEHLNKTCYMVIALLSHTHRLFYTPGTLLLNKKFKNSIFPVRSCVSSALYAFALSA
jgi:hypothetical protein